MKKAVFVFVLFFYLNAVAQSSALQVFYLRGSVTYQTNYSSTWEKLVSGVALYKGYKVKLPANSSVILINKEGLSSTLKQGINEVSPIIESLGIQKDHPNIFSEYLSYIWTRLKEEHKDLDKYSKKYMRNKGIVTRDGCKPGLMQWPYYGTRLMSDSITFLWKSDSKAKKYIFQIYNAPEGGKMLYSDSTKESEYLLNSPAGFLKKGTEYFWTAFSENGDNCVRYSFRIEKTETIIKLEESLAKLASFSDYGEAMTAFVKAEIYESNGFFNEAHDLYLLALKREPDNKFFKEAYNLFLARNTP